MSAVHLGSMHVPHWQQSVLREIVTETSEWIASSEHVSVFGVMSGRTAFSGLT